MGTYRINNWKEFTSAEDPWCPLCNRPRSVHGEPVEVRFNNLSEDAKFVAEEPEKILIFCLPCAKSMVPPEMPANLKDHWITKAFVEALERKRFADGRDA